MISTPAPNGRPSLDSRPDPAGLGEQLWCDWCSDKRRWHAGRGIAFDSRTAACLVAGGMHRRPLIEGALG